MWGGHYIRSNKKCIVCWSVHGNTFHETNAWASNLSKPAEQHFELWTLCLSQAASLDHAYQQSHGNKELVATVFIKSVAKCLVTGWAAWDSGSFFQCSYIHYLCVICWSRIWCQLLLQTCKAHHLTIWPARETLSWIAGWWCCRQTWVQHPSPNLLFHSCPVSLTSTRDWSVQSGPNFSGGTRWCSSCCWIATAFAIGQQHTQYSMLVYNATFCNHQPTLRVCVMRIVASGPPPLKTAGSSLSRYMWNTINQSWLPPWKSLAYTLPTIY